MPREERKDLVDWTGDIIALEYPDDAPPRHCYVLR